MEKLGKMKNDCLKLMEIEGNQSEIHDSKLNFDTNEKILCLGIVLDIQCNDQFGRHIVATADIDVDKTVMI